MTIERRRFIRAQRFTNELLTAAVVDPRPILRETWESREWAVTGSRGGHWIASGPVTWREGMADDDFATDCVTLMAKRSLGEYIRPTNKAGMARWAELEAAA